jgi:hypothetical protein
MATLPASKDFTLVQGQSWLYVIRRVSPNQTITLVGGPSSGTWKVRLYGQLVPTTGSLAFDASAADVATALQQAPRVGGNGVGVSRGGSGSGGSPYVYALTWAGGLVGVEVPLVEIIPSFTPQVVPVVDYLPFDWTGWGGTMSIKPKNTDGTFGTTIVTITDSSNPATVGKIYVGWVDPATEGGTPGAVDPTNGKIGLLIPAVKTAALTPSQFLNSSGNPAGWYDLLLTKSGWARALLKGSVFLDVEPS